MSSYKRLDVFKQMKFTYKMPLDISGIFHIVVYAIHKYICFFVYIILVNVPKEKSMCF